jgi:hypothetical protein
MTLISLITPFFNIVCLSGIIILSRFASKEIQIIIAVALIILGLLSGGAK